MRYLKLFENFVEYDDVFESLYGLEISSVMFTNNGSPRIKKLVRTPGELQEVLNRVSIFFNSTIGFILSDEDQNPVIELFFDPRTKVNIAYGSCNHYVSDADWDKFKIYFDNYYKITNLLGKLPDNSLSTVIPNKEIYFDTFKKMLRTEWDWIPPVDTPMKKKRSRSWKFWK